MPEPPFPIQSSILAADALAERVLPCYRVAGPTRCRLAARGVNDTYRVDGGDATFYLRVSPHGWRTEPELSAELTLIDELDRRGLRVARPVPRHDGDYLSRLAAPEGERFAVLFAAADGADVRDIDGAQSRAYGRLAAHLHDAADAAAIASARFHLDERHLVDEPLASIRAAIGPGNEDLTFLEQVAAQVRRHLAALPRQAPAYGLCHGDLHPGNARFDPAAEPTLFDFDFCGHGWRTYDLTVFLWNAFGEGRSKRWRADRWRAFLRGYREVRPLDEAALEAVPLFLVARQIWLLGLDCSGHTEWLPQWLTPAWFRAMVGTVRGWVADYPILAG